MFKVVSVFFNEPFGPRNNFFVTSPNSTFRGTVFCVINCSNTNDPVFIPCGHAYDKTAFSDYCYTKIVKDKQNSVRCPCCNKGVFNPKSYIIRRPAQQNIPPLEFRIQKYKEYIQGLPNEYKYKVKYLLEDRFSTFEKVNNEMSLVVSASKFDYQKIKTLDSYQIWLVAKNQAPKKLNNYMQHLVLCMSKNAYNIVSRKLKECLGADYEALEYIEVVANDVAEQIREYVPKNFQCQFDLTYRLQESIRRYLLKFKNPTSIGKKKVYIID